MRKMKIVCCTIIFYFEFFLLISGEKLCEESVRVKLDGDVEVHENSITHNGTTFKHGTFWKEGDNYYGCPCLVKQCLRLCDKELLNNPDLTVPDEGFLADIWHEEQKQTVKLHEHFYTIPEKTCTGFFLEPDLYEDESHKILSNGSLHFLIINEVQGPHSFCVSDNNKTLAVKVCTGPEDFVHEDFEILNWLTHLYSVFMMISIVFLLLTLVAFFVSPEMKNLHGKNIACLSGTLMMGFTGLVVSYLTGADSHHYVCVIFAYLTYFFMMSSFFWLNTMCFDIFWTISNSKMMTFSLLQSQNKRFQLYALYSTINPIIMFTCMVIMDHTLDHTSSLWPGIGVTRCWFKSHIGDFVFFQGPVLLLLVFNLIFFVTTLLKLNKMKREVQVSNTGDSGNDCGKEDDGRFFLYSKLFLLMGGTWLMEVISWGFGGPHWIWIVPDLINCSRGVFIFVLCVWNNKKVRVTLLGLLWSRSAAIPDKTTSKSFSSKASEVVNSSAGQNYIKMENF